MDLPDLATGPEVYETSDVESVVLLPEPQHAPPGVETQSLNQASATAAFEHAAVEDVHVVDFLGAVGGTGYRTGVRETPAEKLRRIERELAELRDETAYVEQVREMERAVAAAEQPGYYEQTLRELYERVGALRESTGEKTNERTNETDETETKEKETKKEGRKDEEDRNDRGRVLALDRRLALLEASVGAGHNLRSHINDLTRKVDVLYAPETEIAHVQGEVRELAKELDALAAARRVALLALGTPAPQRPFHAKVDRIYRVLPELEQAAQHVPRLLARLRTLHQVHQDWAHVVSAVGLVDLAVGDMQRDMAAWGESLDAVSAAVDAHADDFARNRAVVEARLAAMEKRLERLG